MVLKTHKNHLNDKNKQINEFEQDYHNLRDRILF